MSAKLGLSPLVLAACIVTGDAGALTASGTTSTESTTTDGASTETPTAEESDSIALDIGKRDIPAEQCASVEQHTTIEEGPSDIIIVVDRAMEPISIEAAFRNFSQLIGDDQIEDVRVMMLAGYPPDGVCIDEPPLGTGDCPVSDDNPPMYRHFSITIEAATLLAQLIDAYPMWGAALRPYARRHVFVVSSGDADMTVAEFDEAFRALDSTFDGYVLHAMAPDQGLDPGDCGGVAMGEPWMPAPRYDTLATVTGGVFENVCNYTVGPLFEALLTRIHAVALSCEYVIPPPPDGMMFDKGMVNVDYSDGGGMQTVGFVEEPSDCPAVSDGWYYDDPDDPELILMCPQTCAHFEALQQASIEIRFGCETVHAG